MTLLDLGFSSDGKEAHVKVQKHGLFGQSRRQISSCLGTERFTGPITARHSAQTDKQHGTHIGLLSSVGTSSYDIAAEILVRIAPTAAG